MLSLAVCHDNFNHVLKRGRLRVSLREHAPMPFAQMK